MKKRLLDVTRVIFYKFTNLYYDYNYFWGIGVLYTHVKQLDKSKFTFDLLTEYDDGNDVFLEKVHLKFTQYLEHYLKIHRKSKQDLAEASIKIQFDIDHILKPASLYGDYFTVQVELTDKKGIHFFQESDSYCFPHNQWLKQQKFIDSLPFEEKKFYWEMP